MHPTPPTDFSDARAMRIKFRKLRGHRSPIGDVDSWAPSSAREQGADIPLYFRTFLQLDVSEGRTQHESEFASFGIIRVLQCLSLESIPAKFKEPVDVLLRILAGELRVLVNELFGVNARCGFSG